MERIASEVDLVACAAPGVFYLPTGKVWSDEDAGKTVGKCVVDGPRLLVRAEISIPTVAASAGVDVGRLVVEITRQNRPIEGSLVFPSAGGFAAVPESRGYGLSRNIEVDTPDAQDEQVQQDEDIARVKGCHCVIGSLMRAERRWGIIYSQGELAVPKRRSRSALETEGLYKNRSQGVINVVLLWQ